MQKSHGENRHYMIIDFHGNPGLHDPRSDYRLSLEQMRSTLTRSGVFNEMKFSAQGHQGAGKDAGKDGGDSRLCIEFKCRAGLDMPGHMQRFVDQLIHHSARLRPQNPIQQILFSAGFPHP